MELIEWLMAHYTLEVGVKTKVYCLPTLITLMFEDATAHFLIKKN